MKYKEYNIKSKDGKSNCIIRSFCKIYNKNYDEVYDELIKLSEQLKCNSFNDIEVFETYMKNNNTNSIEYGKDIQVKELELEKGTYIIFCWDKKEVYHMIPIINNIIYDKDERCLNLYTLKVYKVE